MGAYLHLYRFLVFISTKLSPGNEEFPFLIFLKLLCILEGFVLRELSVQVVWKWWEWTGWDHRTQSWGQTAHHKTHVKAFITVCGNVYMRHEWRPMETARGRLIPRTWSYKQFRAAKWVLGIKSNTPQKQHRLDY